MLRFIRNFLIYSLLLCYVYLGVSATNRLIKLTLNKKQEISTLSAVIKEAVRTDQLGNVTDWVRLRPKSETPALTDIITPESGALDFRIFFELSRRQQQLNNPEEALFWSQLSRYRLRYDILRCGANDSIQIFDQLLNISATDAIKNLLKEHPELIKKSVRRVLDFDTKYPAANSPSFICTTLQKMSKGTAPVPREHWEGLRRSLRAATEAFLNTPDKKTTP